MLPSVREVRERIDNAGPDDIQIALKTIYLTASRVSEVVGKASAHDTTTARGPIGDDMTKDVYQMGEEADSIALFHLKISKRQGKPRTVALPLEERFEPWTADIVKRFERFRAEPVFNFTRQQLWQAAKGVFVGLTYPIETYKLSWKEGEQVLQKKIDRHDRDFALHALRHLRVTELLDFYGFTLQMATTFVGWTFAGMFGGGGMAERYGHLDWQSYYPKLRRIRR